MPQTLKELRLSPSNVGLSVQLDIGRPIGYSIVRLFMTWTMWTLSNWIWIYTQLSDWMSQCPII